MNFGLHASIACPLPTWKMRSSMIEDRCQAYMDARRTNGMHARQLPACFHAFQ